MEKNYTYILDIYYSGNAFKKAKQTLFKKVVLT